MGRKISQFPAATTINDADVLAGVQSTSNRKFSFGLIKGWLQSVFVPVTRTINNIALSSDITLSPSDIGAVSTSREVNGKALSADITLTASDVGAQPEITASGILKGDGQGGVSAATAGTDYATPAQLDAKANPGQIGYPETGTTASQNYTAGQFICWNGLTYTADTNIATGTTLSASGGNKNLTECVGGGVNYFAPVSGQWTPNSNASAITDRCYYLIVGNLMLVNIAVYLTSVLNNHTEVEIISDLASTFGRSVRINAVISCPAVFYDATVTSLVLRTVIVNNKLIIRNDSGASIRTSYAIFGQIVVPVN